MTTQELLKDMEPDYDAMPIKERTDFQRLYVVPAMLGNDFFEGMTTAEKFPFEYKWTQDYGKKIGDILDDKDVPGRDAEKNKQIRDFIFDHQYEKACELILPMLGFKPEESELAA